jgi:hypothetical protein
MGGLGIRQRRQTKLNVTKRRHWIFHDQGQIIF